MLSDTKIKYLFGYEQVENQSLFSQMFRDRAAQFKTRLGWDVFVDPNGQERDEYDHPRALYVIITAGGQHRGSLRLLPTTGPCMINDHFQHIIEKKIQCPGLWEITRFCISPKFGKTQKITPHLLFLACAQLAQNFDLTGGVGVFDSRMRRIYKRIGHEPKIIKPSKDLLIHAPNLFIGRWSFNKKIEFEISLKCPPGTLDLVRAEFLCRFGQTTPAQKAWAAGLTAPHIEQAAFNRARAYG